MHYVQCSTLSVSKLPWNRLGSNLSIKSRYEATIIIAPTMKSQFHVKRVVSALPTLDLEG